MIRIESLREIETLLRFVYKYDHKDTPVRFVYRYNQRHIAVKIAYLGWKYHGFVSQENIKDTIEVNAHCLGSLDDKHLNFVSRNICSQL